jgi:hypothetical protein
MSLVIDRETIAQMCHENNRIWCRINGDDSQVSWEEASADIRNSARAGVSFILQNPKAGDDLLHDHWMAEKLLAGWTHGEVKDSVAKTHPCLVPYNKLPPEQQMKDRLFRLIVIGLTGGRL